MPLTFEYCRTCGEKTEIDPAEREADRRCRLCGGPCSGHEEWETPALRRSSGRPADFDAEGHVPAEMVAATCPRCHADVAVDPARPLTKQRCHACGRALLESRVHGPKKKPARISRDGILRRRTRERVWMPVAGITLAIVLVTIFGIWLGVRRKPEVVPVEEAGKPPPREQITELMTRFHHAATADELLPLIRDPDVFEKQVRAWCAARPKGLPMRGKLLGISYPRDVPGTRVARATVSFPHQSDTHILTVETPAGFRIDWRAFSGIGDLSVAEFLTQKPATTVLLMAVVHRSDYYNNAYADSGAWICLRVIDGQGGHPFHAYVPRSSEVLMKAIAVLPEADSRRDLQRSLVSRPMALRLRFRSPDAAAALQAEIEEIPGDGWYVP